MFGSSKIQALSSKVKVRNNKFKYPNITGINRRTFIVRPIIPFYLVQFGFVQTSASVKGKGKHIFILYSLRRYNEKRETQETDRDRQRQRQRQRNREGDIKTYTAYRIHT